MDVFCHHLYEYEKGLRNLILHTTHPDNKKLMLKRLNNKNIAYLIYQVSDKKINILFGDDHCIEVIKKIDKNDLTEYTPEEDFILGIMLGYDRLKQCQRYIDFKKERADQELIAG